MDRLVHAIHFAAEKHSNQRRKNALKSPYINHPIKVMYQLTACGISDVPTLMAAVLHDTIEDTATSYEEIAGFFGERVAQIVSECTNDKSMSKIDRKRFQISHTSSISTEAKLVKLADKLSNLQGIIADPPLSWSLEVIRGYAYWCYAVCAQIGNVNENLNDRLLATFEALGVKDPENTLDTELEKYYAQLIDAAGQTLRIRSDPPDPNMPGLRPFI